MLAAAKCVSFILWLNFALIFGFITFAGDVCHHRCRIQCPSYGKHDKLDINISMEISSIKEINRSIWKKERKKEHLFVWFVLLWWFSQNRSLSHTHTHLFEQTLSSGTHSHGCWGISPSESLIQWYSIHRAHFIAVVYSRLALKRSGANSQAPFRLNSSVKNSWQYLQKTIQINSKLIDWIHKINKKTHRQHLHTCSALVSYALILYAVELLHQSKMVFLC